MRTGDIVYCIKDYWNFEKGEKYHIDSVWADGGGCSVKIILCADGNYIKQGYMPFSKEKLEEHFTNLELERRLKLRRINSIE